MTELEKLLQNWNNGVLRGAKIRLARELNVDDSTVSAWVAGRAKPTADKIEKMSKLFNVSEQTIKDVFNEENINNVFEAEKVQFIPVWGIVSAAVFKGTNLSEEPIDFVPLPTKDKRIFAMKVKGSCMEPTIKNGEYVILKKQEYTDYDGQIVLAVVDEDYTLKRFFSQEDSAELRPINTDKFKSIVRPLKDILIKGVYKGVFRKDDFI